MDLQGKTAIVTGGSRGIGRAVCLELASRGAQVAVNFHNREKAAQEVVRTIGNNALAIQGDVSNRAAVQAMMARIEAELGAPRHPRQQCRALVSRSLARLRRGAVRPDVANKRQGCTLLLRGGGPRDDPARLGPDREPVVERSDWHVHSRNHDVRRNQGSGTNAYKETGV